MKKFLLSAMLMAVSVLPAVHAREINPATEKAKDMLSIPDGIFQTIKPAYLTGAVIPSWRDGWFLHLSGGVSAFVGSPIGCDDLFGRIKPALQMGIGKWHTPSIGNRLVFQGFEWKSGTLQAQKYRYFHADLLWNLTPTFNIGNDDCRWDIIPIIGLGLIDNRDADRRPFAINYGIQGRYRIADCLHITAEIANATTFKDSDGYGSARQLGDHLLNFTAGVTWTFGRHAGWKKIIDARPYMVQNEQLMAYAYAQNEKNKALEHRNSANERLVVELRKILAIEGLLDKYAKQIGDCGNMTFVIGKGYPVNDYSGLNSLRRRLREGRNGNTENGDETNNKMTGRREISQTDGIDDRLNDSIQGLALQEYHAQIGQDDCLGAPIYFFFELATAKLVDNSQLVNLHKIVRVANKYNLKVEVTGAADSATGTIQINENLGNLRAKFIADYLVINGIPAENISIRSEGGIDSYQPHEANRNAIVRLRLP